MCDGAAVSRTTEAALFAVIGTAYGAGDGSTTFNVPDLRQRFPLGKAAAGTGSTLGGTGGAIDHVHSVDPPTTATFNTSLGVITVSGPNDTIGVTIGLTQVASDSHIHTVSVSDDPHNHNVDIAPFNSASANPPFVVFNAIIKN